jgi:hypothetical protein
MIDFGDEIVIHNTPFIFELSWLERDSLRKVVEDV